MVTDHPASVAGTIEGFSPVSVGPVAAVFARAIVAQARPPSAARAKALLFAAAKLGDFAVSIGVVPSTEMLFDEALVERFILRGTEGHSAGTRRTLRTSLRALARALAPRVGPGATPLPRGRAKSPYTQGEIDTYLALAAAQPTRARRRRASGLIVLGAGVGLVGTDLRSVPGTDVMARSGGLVVVVGGKKARVVPVLARYHDLLGASARVHAGLVIGDRGLDRVLDRHRGVAYEDARRLTEGPGSRLRTRPRRSSPSLSSHGPTASASSQAWWLTYRCVERTSYMPVLVTTCGRWPYGPRCHLRDDVDRRLGRQVFVPCSLRPAPLASPSCGVTLGQAHFHQALPQP